MSQEPDVLELNNYKVLQKEDGSLWLLGKGGYGTTYKAEHKHLGRICALKVINDDLMSNNKIRQRFLQEAKAAAALNHPNIAIVHDFGESNGIFYYAMEFCSGGDLEEFSQSRGPQPWSVVRDLALQILAALREAHGKGLLHRDLKPSNIMLASDDGSVNLKMIDFGLVKVLDHHESSETNLMLTQEGAFMGNPLTASPEQLQEGHLDERSDLFSLGVTLWYLLLGGSPFAGTSTAQLVHQRLGEDEYVDLLPSDLNESGRSIIGKLLSKNRDDRFSSAEEAFLAIEQEGADRSGLGGPSAATSPSDESVETAAPQKITDWSEIWSIRDQLYKFSYGTYYACEGTVPGVPRTTLFLPNHESNDFAEVCDYADKLVHAKTQLLNGFYQKGTMDGQAAYACPPLSLGSFQSLLQVEEHLSLQNHLTLFQQIAMAVDESIQMNIPGVELEITEVILGLSNRAEASPQSEGEWLNYFQQKKEVSAAYVEQLEFTLLPKLNNFVSADEAMVTLGDDDLAATPLARFGGLVYRSISGMAVKQTAYMSPSAHVSTSHVSEKSNFYLSEVIADLDQPTSAMDFLQQLCQIEGVRWSFDAIEATQLAKEAEKAAISKSYASMGMSMTALPSPRANIQLESAASSTSPPPISQPAEQATTAQTSVQEKSTATAPPTDFSSVTSPSSSMATSVSQSTTPPPIITPVNQGKASKNKWIIIGAAAAACVVLVGGGFFTYQHFSKDDKPRRSGSGGEGGYKDPEHGIVDHGEDELIKVVFAEVSMGKAELPDDAVISLCDSGEKQVASLKIQDGHASSPDFPRNIFSNAGKWPMKVKLEASGYKMKPVLMELSDFKNIDGGGKQFDKSLKLEPRAYLEFAPVVKFNGNEVSGYSKLMKEYLHPSDPSVDWKLTNVDGKIAISLPPDKTFPIKVILTVPHMEDLPCTLTKDETPVWDFKVKQRKVRLMSLGSFTELKFVPSVEKVDNISMQELLRSMAKSTIQLSQFEEGAGTWMLPEIEGQIEVVAQAGSWSASIHADAQYRVFTQSDKTVDGREVSNEAFKKQKETAEAGDIDAQYALGLLYLDGEGVKMNKEASAAWFRVAAEQGDRDAQYNLGQAYKQGTGVEVDEREAIKWYIKAAAQGESKAQNSLGLYYQWREDMPKDFKKAEEWYKKSAAQGYARAIYNLAVLYESKDAGMLNMEKARKLYQQASEKGFALATVNLALCYLNGDGGLEKSIPKAKELMKKAAENGNDTAQKYLDQLNRKYPD